MDEMTTLVHPPHLNYILFYHYIVKVQRMFAKQMGKASCTRSVGQDASDYGGVHSMQPVETTYP